MSHTHTQASEWWIKIRKIKTINNNSTNEAGRQSTGVERAKWESLPSLPKAIMNSASKDSLSGENLREQVYVEITLNDIVTSCWRKVKAAQSLSNMNEPTALHTEGTAKVSEYLW
jgi:hypothetical protein